MIRRTSRTKIMEKLAWQREQNPEWSIVDLGCGRNGSCPQATVYVDKNNWSASLPGKTFISHDLNNLPLPFEDKEFDYCWASHILEHVSDPVGFLKEVTRISKAGYIEVPTPLIDNLVSGDDVYDPHGHKWWIYYDDCTSNIIVRPRRHIVHKTVDIPELNKLYPFFRSSFVVELEWNDSVGASLGDEKYSYEEKEYDLSVDKVEPWILGSSVLMRVKGAQ